MGFPPLSLSLIERPCSSLAGRDAAAGGAGAPQVLAGRFGMGGRRCRAGPEAAAGAVAVAAGVEGSVGAGILNAEEHAPPRWCVARVGDEIRIERQPAPGAYVPPLAQKQARPFHILPPIACQHGSHPLSRAHKKGAPHPWKIHGRSAPCWCVMKFCAAKMDRLNAVCLIIAPAMGLSRKIGGFLMAGASFFGIVLFIIP